MSGAGKNRGWFFIPDKDDEVLVMFEHGDVNRPIVVGAISGVALGSNLFNLSATNGTLTFSSAYNGSTAQTVGLNLGNANSWTALQQFANASSTLFSSTYASSTRPPVGSQHARPAPSRSV